MDPLSKSQRSALMASIRSKDTAPELAVRKVLTAMGIRYRLHGKGLPGRPDIVIRRLNLVIFVHGCFWHRHRCRRGKAMPAVRRAFWRAKFEANRKRDRRSIAALRRAGWRVLVIWECQTEDAGRLVERVVPFVSGQSRVKRSSPRARLGVCRLQA
jgi:DNA mismatch endonuclease (patch repair protein)